MGTCSWPEKFPPIRECWRGHPAVLGAGGGSAWCALSILWKNIGKEPVGGQTVCLGKEDGSYPSSVHEWGLCPHLCTSWSAPPGATLEI